MGKKFKPREEVINLLEKALNNLGSPKKIADCLLTLTGNEIYDPEALISEVRNDTKIGKAFYYLAESMYKIKK